MADGCSVGECGIIPARAGFTLAIDMGAKTK